MFCIGVFGMYNYAIYSGLLRLAVATISHCSLDGFFSTFTFLLKLFIFRLTAVDPLFLFQICWSGFLRDL